MASGKLARDSGLDVEETHILVVWMNMKGIVKTKERKKPTMVCVVIYWSLYMSVTKMRKHESVAYCWNLVWYLRPQWENTPETN
jgi:hypothetical protein